MSIYTSRKNDNYVRKIQMLRRSNAAGVHKNRKTRSYNKKKSIDFEMKSSGM